MAGAALGLLALVGCGGATVGPPTLDEPAWLARLQQARPDLLPPFQGTVRDPGWQATAGATGTTTC